MYPLRLSAPGSENGAPHVTRRQSAPVSIALDQPLLYKRSLKTVNALDHIPLRRGLARLVERVIERVQEARHIRRSVVKVRRDTRQPIAR